MRERSQINSLALFKEPEKEEKTKPKSSRRKEIKNIRAKINELENRKIGEKSQ